MTHSKHTSTKFAFLLGSVRRENHKDHNYGSRGSNESVGDHSILVPYFRGDHSIPGPIYGGDKKIIIIEESWNWWDGGSLVEKYIMYPWSLHANLFMGVGGPVHLCHRHLLLFMYSSSDSIVAQCPECVAQCSRCVAQCPECVAQCPRCVMQCPGCVVSPGIVLWKRFCWPPDLDLWPMTLIF